MLLGQETTKCTLVARAAEAIPRDDRGPAAARGYGPQGRARPGTPFGEDAGRACLGTGSLVCSSEESWPVSTLI